LVSVATITNDVRLLNVPKLKVCALRFTEAARNRILKNGGQVFTFDQLAQKAPTGNGTFLVRGKRSREALKHFGKAIGVPGGHAKPYVRTRGKTLEHSHGLRWEMVFVVGYFIVRKHLSRKTYISNTC